MFVKVPMISNILISIESVTTMCKIIHELLHICIIHKLCIITFLLFFYYFLLLQNLIPIPEQHFIFVS